MAFLLTLLEFGWALLRYSWPLVNTLTDPGILLVNTVGIVLWSTVNGSGVPVHTRVGAVVLSESLLLLTWLLGYLYGLVVALVIYIWIWIFDLVTPARISPQKAVIFFRGKLEMKAHVHVWTKVSALASHTQTSGLEFCPDLVVVTKLLSACSKWSGDLSTLQATEVPFIGNKRLRRTRFLRAATDFSGKAQKWLRINLQIWWGNKVSVSEISFKWQLMLSKLIFVTTNLLDTTKAESCEI